MWFDLVLTACLLGVGFAADAFSVSLANGLNEPKMKKRKLFGIAAVFAVFQFMMPMIGWICVNTIAERFEQINAFIPWVALALLGFIGGKMLYEGTKHKDGEEEKPAVGFWALVVQGVATSIDALSGGFDMLEYEITEALICCGIIGVLTFGICVAGLILGRKFGTKLAGKAAILGGSILIIIGLKIIIESFIK